MDCSPWDTAWPKRLFIKEWLKGKFENNQETDPVNSEVYYGNKNSLSCRKQTNLKTSIALIFDASAGINPLFAATYILPISGFTGDVSPQFTETLEIDFAVRNRENNALCEQWAGRKGALGLFTALTQPKAGRVVYH